MVIGSLFRNARVPHVPYSLRLQINFVKRLLKHPVNNLLRKLRLAAAALALASPTIALGQAAAGDPLPSWNDGAPKRAIVDFVTRVTTEGGPDFVPPAARIATIDNDGTLWCEQPMYVQGFFVFDRVKQLAATNPGVEAQAALSRDPGGRPGDDGAVRIERDRGPDRCDPQRHDAGRI